MGKIQEANLVSNDIINGNTYDSDYPITFYEYRQVKSGYLAEDTTIDGIAFRNEISFYDNGKIKEANLVSNDIIHGNTYDSNYLITFYEDGQVKDGTIILNNPEPEPTPNPQPEPTPTIPIYQDDSLFELGTITFYENENIESGTLKNNHIIDGIIYSRTSISFYENGNVKQGTLVEDTTINGIIYNANSDITFYEDGQVEQGALSDNQIINNIFIYFNPNEAKLVKYNQQGNITNLARTISLNQDTTIDGVYL